jgi:hypothetical protein
VLGEVGGKDEGRRMKDEQEEEGGIAKGHEGGREELTRRREERFALAFMELRPMLVGTRAHGRVAHATKDRAIHLSKSDLVQVVRVKSDRGVYG